MGRRLRMTAELGDWLTELGESESATAAEVGAALVAVMQSGDPAGLAILGEPTTPPSPDPLESADYAYQQQLEKLQHLRHRVAVVASSRKRTDLMLDAERAAGADAARLAELERELVAARQREEQLTLQSQRYQNEVDAFRSAKETAKALHTVADAQVRIAEAVEAAGGEPDADVAQLRADLRAAEDRLRALVPVAAAAEPVPGLLELRADLLGSDTRILLAVEPADTVTLLAVLEGPAAVSEHGAQAIKLAGDLLTEIREDGWPGDFDEITLQDARAFMTRFFPADEHSISGRASRLAESVPLGKLRTIRQLTIEHVAQRSGLSADRVAQIEAEGLRTAEVHEAVALMRALGARLELPAGSGPAVY